MTGDIPKCFRELRPSDFARAFIVSARSARGENGTAQRPGCTGGDAGRIRPPRSRPNLALPASDLGTAKDIVVVQASDSQSTAGTLISPFTALVGGKGIVSCRLVRQGNTQRLRSELLDEVVRRVLQVGSPHKIVLFGSRARGRPAG